MSTQSTEAQASEKKKQKPVYMVTVEVGGKIHHRVGAADNKEQAIRKATEGIVKVKTLTPWEVQSWAVEGKPFKFQDPDAKPAPAAVAGLPAGDRDEPGVE